jgi:hypothetical protein
MTDTPDARLWSLTKDSHKAEGFARPIEGVGIELRFLWNGHLRWSQVFKTWPELEATEKAKRSELEGRGWTGEVSRDC